MHEHMSHETKNHLFPHTCIKCSALSVSNPSVLRAFNSSFLKAPDQSQELMSYNGKKEDISSTMVSF